MSEKSILDANLRILKARFPVVLERILAVGNGKSDNFFYEDSNDGSTLMIQRGEHAFPAYGENKREQILKRWTEQIDNHNIVPIFLIAIMQIRNPRTAL